MSDIHAAKKDDRTEKISMVADVAIEAASDDGDGKKKPARFKVRAYNGGPLRVNRWGDPVVIDLAGLEYADGIVANLDHDSGKRVGHVTQHRSDGKRLDLEGVVSGTGEAAREFVDNAGNGFPWKASVEAQPITAADFIGEGNTVEVNGRTIEGPVFVSRRTKLYGVGFLNRGADEKSKVTVAASAANQGGSDVEFTQWIEAMGFKLDDLSEQQKTHLMAKYDAEVEAKAKADDDAKESDSRQQPMRSAATLAAITAAAFDVDEVRDAAREHDANIEAVLAEHDGTVESKKFQEIRAAAYKGARELKAKAIGERWPAVKLEAAAVKAASDLRVELIRAERPKGPAIHSSTRDVSADVIEAAMAQTLGLPGLEKQYKAETLEAAHKNLRNISLQQVLIMAAAANGYLARPGEPVHPGNVKEVLQYAFSPIHAGPASTLSLPGIFSNLANKELLAGYEEEDQTWREIARVASVNDFKEVTSYRLLDDMEYEELGPGGEIKHGRLSEEERKRRARTYAKMFSLERADIINDDLQAFDDLRNRLGRGGARKFNNVFWATFLANVAFFSAGNGNFIDGADSELAIDGEGLEKAIIAFRSMKSPDGKRIGGTPQILMVPPELQFVAQRLHQSTEIVSGTDGMIPNSNIHAGRYRPVVVDQLSDTSFTGASAKAWYLLRSPTMLAAIVVSFLNGQQTPTVESADADFNRLGVDFRGYHDFGCDLEEPLAGVKSKGEA